MRLSSPLKKADPSPVAYQKCLLCARRPAFQLTADLLLTNILHEMRQSKISHFPPQHWAAGGNHALARRFSIKMSLEIAAPNSICIRDPFEMTCL
jgi:hypothetical protein